MTWSQRAAPTKPYFFRGQSLGSLNSRISPNLRWGTFGSLNEPSVVPRSRFRILQTWKSRKSVPPLNFHLESTRRSDSTVFCFCVPSLATLSCIFFSNFETEGAFGSLIHQSFRRRSSSGQESENSGDWGETAQALDANSVVRSRTA